jgi:hypothetical protein
MGQVDLGKRAFFAEAAARIRLLLNECIGLSPAFVSAGAMTEPLNFGSAFRAVGNDAVWSDYGEIPECLVC